MKMILTETDTSSPHYGNEALAYNDAIRWETFCESERRQGFWIGLMLSLVAACALCFLL